MLCSSTLYGQQLQLQSLQTAGIHQLTCFVNNQYPVFYKDWMVIHLVLKEWCWRQVAEDVNEQ